VNAQVDAIEQRTGETPAIALDLVGKAGAFALGVAPEAAGARVQCMATRLFGSTYCVSGGPARPAGVPMRTMSEGYCTGDGLSAIRSPKRQSAGRNYGGFVARIYVRTLWSQNVGRGCWVLRGDLVANVRGLW